ncbi:hypothetical protein SAMN05443582_103409 [Phyllobacterium sp. OV277]|nr:hypothetical protein SAMN05443582_103409 [Phyllobacterium sp. OV277]
MKMVCCRGSWFVVRQAHHEGECGCNDNRQHCRSPMLQNLTPFTTPLPHGELPELVEGRTTNRRHSPPSALSGISPTRGEISLQSHLAQSETVPVVQRRYCQCDLPPCGGDVRQDRGGVKNASLSVPQSQWRGLLRSRVMGNSPDGCSRRSSYPPVVWPRGSKRASRLASASLELTGNVS